MKNTGEEVSDSRQSIDKCIERIFSINKIVDSLEVVGEIPKTKKLLKKAVKVAWPSTVESFLMAMVAFVDTIMVSSLGAYAIAAVGLTTQPKFLCLTLFILSPNHRLHRFLRFFYEKISHLQFVFLLIDSWTYPCNLWFNHFSL